MIIIYKSANYKAIQLNKYHVAGDQTVILIKYQNK